MTHSLKEIGASLAAVTVRFPLTLLLLLIFTVLISWMIITDTAPVDNYRKVLFTFSIACILSLALRLTLAGFTNNPLSHVAEAVIVLLFSWLYWQGLPEYFAWNFYFNHVTLSFALIGTVGFALGVAPLFRGTYRDDYFYNFLMSIGLLILQSIVVAVIVVIASNIAIFSFISLLDFNLDSYFYSILWNTWIFLFIIPIYFLRRYPKTMPSELEYGENFLRFLFRYIFLPFLCLYLVILYGYLIKTFAIQQIALKRDFQISALALAIIGYITYLLSYNLQDSVFVKRLRRAIPILLLPPTFLVLSIMLERISHYGWTIPRYLALEFCLWLVLISGYNIVYNARAKLIVIPASMFVILLLTVAGPWGMTSVSEQSQLAQIEAFMQIERLKADQKASASSAIHYICDYHGCDSLRAIPKIASLMDQGHDHAYTITKELGY